MEEYALEEVPVPLLIHAHVNLVIMERNVNTVPALELPVMTLVFVVETENVMLQIHVHATMVTLD
jgi:hypothetical protein